jgi:integrase
MENPAKHRRGHGEGAIYQTADGRWRACVDLGWDNGKRQRKYLSAATRAEVARKLRAAQQIADAGLPIAAGRTATFGAWLTTYLDTIAVQRVRPRTLEMYKGYANHRIIPTIGGHRLDKLQPEHLERFYRGLAADGLSNATILQCHRIISRALKVAMQRGYVARNVATLVDAPAVQRAEVSPPTLAQGKAILKAATDLRNAARWSVAMALGLRQGEALGLSWADVDLNGGSMAIRQALQRQQGKGLVLVEPKSRAGRRTIALTPELVSQLRAHRKQQRAERLAAGPTWTEHDLVFAQANGKPVDPRADYAAWKALLKAADVPDYRLHDARHFAATLLLSQGVPARVAMEILGHSQIGLTLGTYSHVGRELARDAADRVGAALWSG